MTMRIRDDKYAGYMEESSEMGYTPDCEPVDLYGKRVNLVKDEPTNLAKTAAMVQDHYGLSKPNTDYGANYGDLAKSEEESQDEADCC